VKKRIDDEVAGCVRGWPSLSLQLGMSSFSARGSTTAPESTCEPRQRFRFTAPWSRQPALTNFASLFDDDNAYLFSLLLLKLLEPDCGAETCRTPTYDANVHLIRDALNSVEVYIFVP
jgi:hypothetical protein